MRDRKHVLRRRMEEKEDCERRWDIARMLTLCEML
jgi:hypothetical protein